jgi:hypothetical protein
MVQVVKDIPDSASYVMSIEVLIIVVAVIFLIVVVIIRHSAQGLFSYRVGSVSPQPAALLKHEYTDQPFT